ncbi:Crp/Fnr family transcriptional regulator [Methylobacterium gregans]|uniref:Fumarate and nitrate reduction regulatory protein n=1 Tax=Methylobacterium gregans TaxID=374424 RepID=A0AA37HRR6_9HYPH|nr:Crp/Fnr family transcriptional regulator [Methylobacterium gregans]MDQ0522941.1 CRP-like cAMP-binding protein [Methylobacterium gregans]GJD80531.1 Fumarate and nitrate reduction regulatory protein [Methylobacterium gregans]GLS57344.1 Crp/Fnr family transcriptional regulator [Methylobacterium gregans]
MLNASCLHRPELTAALASGDRKLDNLTVPYPRTFAAGTTIVQQGAEHDYVYRLRTGWVGRVRALPDGRTQYLMVFLPGDLFAIKSVFVAAHPDAVVALSDVTVERLAQHRLRDAFDTDPEIALRCTWQIVEEERRLHNWVVSLGQGSAEERIAHLLLEFSVRIGAATGTGRALEYGIPLTQDQLGNVLGLTSVHVNRVLRRLREDGLVSIRNRVVSIHDAPALERMAEPLRDATLQARARPETAAG